MERHSERLRRAELGAVECYFRPGMRVLEIGGGSGYQASIIVSLGCHVSSIDVPDRPLPNKVYFPVQEYNGRNIPFPAGSFDLIFSSNVLEHINELAHVLNEIRRVMKPEGLAIHVLPSPAWRFWTSLAHYPFLLLHAVGRNKGLAGVAEVPTLRGAVGKLGLKRTAKRILLPGAHGNYSSAFAELYYFSRRRWLRTFEQYGFRVQRIEHNNLFYTGYGLCPHLSLRTRHVLAHVLGSAAHIFFTRRKV